MGNPSLQNVGRRRSHMSEIYLKQAFYKSGLETSIIKHVAGLKFIYEEAPPYI